MEDRKILSEIDKQYFLPGPKSEYTQPKTMNFCNTNFINDNPRKRNPNPTLAKALSNVSPSEI